MRSGLVVGLGSIAVLVLGCGTNAGDAAARGVGGDGPNGATGGLGGGQLVPTGGGTDGEVCGNGLDDEGDGLPDDECTCDVGATRGPTARGLRR